MSIGPRSDSSSDLTGSHYWLGEAEEWRRRHGARFEMSKYMLILFTRNTYKKTITTINITGSTITPAADIQYFGVIFDRRLCFKQYIQHIAKKGIKFALTITKIANSTWGTTYHQTRL